MRGTCLSPRSSSSFQLLPTKCSDQAPRQPFLEAQDRQASHSPSLFSLTAEGEIILPLGSHLLPSACRQQITWDFSWPAVELGSTAPVPRHTAYVICLDRKVFQALSHPPIPTGPLLLAHTSLSESPPLGNFPIYLKSSDYQEAESESQADPHPDVPVVGLKDAADKALTLESLPFM